MIIMKYKPKKYYRQFFMLVLIVFIMGCVEVKQPTVNGSATIKHITIEYDLDIVLTNPNNFDFTVSDISVFLQRKNDENIGTGTISGGRIRKQDSKHFYGMLEIKDTLLNAQNDEKIYLIIDTTAKGGIWPLEKEEKIYRKIEMDNPIKGKTELEIKI